MSSAQHMFFKSRRKSFNERTSSSTGAERCLRWSTEGEKGETKEKYSLYAANPGICKAHQAQRRKISTRALACVKRYRDHHRQQRGTYREPEEPEPAGDEGEDMACDGDIDDVLMVGILAHVNAAINELVLQIHGRQ